MTKPPYAVRQDPSVKISDSPELRPAPNNNWEARRELATALRQLNAAVLTADIPTSQLRALTDALRTHIAAAESSPRVYGRLAQAERVTAAKPGDTVDLLYEMSPSIGHANAAALPMHVWMEDGRVHARVTPDWSREGPLDHLHGGVIALLFDQLLGVAQRMAKTSGRTGTITIRYHHPTPLNQTLHLVADIKRIDGRKKFLTGEMWADDVRTASCEAVFVSDKNHQHPPATDIAQGRSQPRSEPDSQP